MEPDKAIEEIRKVRQAISAAHGHDTRRLLSHYKELESKHSERMRRTCATDKAS